MTKPCRPTHTVSRHSLCIRFLFLISQTFMTPRFWRTQPFILRKSRIYRDVGCFQQGRSLSRSYFLFPYRYFRKNSGFLLNSFTDHLGESSRFPEILRILPTGCRRTGRWVSSCPDKGFITTHRKCSLTLSYIYVNYTVYLKKSLKTVVPFSYLVSVKVYLCRRPGGWKIPVLRPILPMNRRLCPLKNSLFFPQSLWPWFSDLHFDSRLPLLPDPLMKDVYTELGLVV